MGWVDQFFDNMASGLSRLGFGAYGVVALVVFLETLLVVGQFLPGAIFLAFVGFLCYLQAFDFESMLIVVFLAHYSGEIINYYLGRVKGRSLFTENSRYFRPSILAMAEEKFRAGGWRIIFTTQFVGFLRAFISFAAGATHYPLPRFLFVMFISAAAWSIAHLGLGFLLGASWRKAADYVEDFALIVLVCIVVFAFSGWVSRRVAQHAGEMGLWLERTARAIHRSRIYSRIASRSPRLFRFLEARLDLAQPWGLAASFGWLLGGFLAAVFVAILYNVSSDDDWRYFDFAIMNLLSQLRHREADKLFNLIAGAGSAPVLCAASLLAMGGCAVRRQFKSCCVIAASMVLAAVASSMAGILYAKARPDSSLAALRVLGRSFSGTHAAVAAAFFTAVYAWLWRHPGPLLRRALPAFLFVAGIALVGFARVYLGALYPSDFIAGTCLGVAVVVLAMTCVNNVQAIAETQARSDIGGAAVIVFLIAAMPLRSAFVPLPPLPRSAAVMPLEEAVTTATLPARLPDAAYGLTGEKVAPVTIALYQDPEYLAGLLHLRAWYAVPPDSFFRKGIAEPVFPMFIDTRPAVLTLRKDSDSGRLLLRLWETPLRLEGKPVWAGAVVDEQKRRTKLGFEVFRMKPDLDLAVKSFRSDLDPSTVSDLPGLRPRGLYPWKPTFLTHGSGLLIR